MFFKLFYKEHNPKPTNTIFFIRIIFFKLKVKQNQTQWIYYQKK